MLSNLALKSILQKRGKTSIRVGACQRGLLSLPPSSKESSPTLASKVDQLEGMLKMLREDLKKVNVLRTVCPGYGNKMPLTGRAREVGETHGCFPALSLCMCLGAIDTHCVRGLHCPMCRKPGPFWGKALDFSQASLGLVLTANPGVRCQVHRSSCPCLAFQTRTELVFLWF